MQVSSIEFLPNGLLLVFSDGSTVNATHVVRDGVLYLEGLSQAQLSALDAFNASIDISVRYDPRFSCGGIGSDGTVGPSFSCDLTDADVTGGDPLYNVVEDTTPQLGANLDVGGFVISTCVVNGSIIVAPNGTGNLVADTDGDARGTYGVDLQMSRTLSQKVNKGAFSVIGGGSDNAIASGVSGAVIAGGQANQVNANHGAIAGGSGNVVDANAGSVPGGFYARSRLLGQHAFSSGMINAAGDAQTTVTVLQNITTDATPSEMLAGGALGNPPDGGWFYTYDGGVYSVFMQVLAASIGSTDAKRFDRSFLFKNDAGTLSLIGSVDTIGTDKESAGAAAWDIDIDVDSPGQRLVITVTGDASETVYWIARLQAVELFRS